MAIARIGPPRSANKLNPHLFVYGTLRTGAKNRFAALLRRSADRIGGGRVQGRLYRIANYPGFVPSRSEHDWVKGEVFRLANAGALFSVLDEYEGREFQRIVLPVLLDSGEWIEAWVYVYAGLVRAKPWIPSGDFFDGG